MAIPSKIVIRRFTLLAVGASLCGCVQTTPQWDSQFGTTTRVLLASQVVDPAAQQNPNPVAGMDGKSARHAVQSYEKASQAPEPRPASLILLGK